jgi:hypothetical protein
VSTSVIPAIIDAVVAQLPAYMPTGTLVYDGFPFTGNREHYVAVGIDDPDSEDASNSARSEHARATYGTSRNENGSVACAAVAWNGDGDIKAARDAAFAMCAAAAALSLADKTLAVEGVLQTVYGTRQELRQAQTDAGAYAYVLFDVLFAAFI